MKAVVIYDSVYGNTEQIARAIAAALGTPDEVKLFRAGDITPEQLAGIDLLIVGSPTQGFRAVKSVTDFLNSIPGDALKGVRVAAFDTRIAGKEAGVGARFITKIGGFAAPRIADALKKKGGDLIASPEGFNVKGTEGPLAPGEVERAAAWAKQLLAAQKSSK